MMAFPSKKQIEREKRVNQIQPVSLVVRLCQPDFGKVILEEFDIDGWELHQLLKKVKVPLPIHLHTFRQNAVAILGNLKKYEDYLTRTAQLRSDLAKAQKELESSYVQFDGMGK